MTEQGLENFEYEGRELWLYSTPRIPRHPRVIEGAWPPRSTALYRGYLGSWQVADGRLYLTGLEGRFQLSGPRPLFADWVSGRLLTNNPEDPEGAWLIKLRRGRVVGVKPLNRSPREHQARLISLGCYVFLVLLLIPPALTIVALFSG